MNSRVILKWFCWRRFHFCYEKTPEKKNCSIIMCIFDLFMKAFHKLVHDTHISLLLKAMIYTKIYPVVSHSKSGVWWFHARESHYPFMQYIYFPTVLWAWHICAWYTYCIPPRRGANLSHPIESSSLSQQNSVFECVVFVWERHCIVQCNNRNYHKNNS